MACPPASRWQAVTVSNSMRCSGPCRATRLSPRRHRGCLEPRPLLTNDNDQKGRTLGFFDKLLSNLGGGAGPSCPTCGGTLDNEDLVEGSYWCESCGLLLKAQGDELVDVKSLRGSGRSGRTCEACQGSLDDGDHYLPYEDGRNSHAYIRCSCGHENIQYGFGEDD
jgi:hypothetical protein